MAPTRAEKGYPVQPDRRADRELHELLLRGHVAGGRRGAAGGRPRARRAKSTSVVTPGSEQVHLTIERDGQMADLEAIGATVLANACGPCIGQWKRDDIEKGDANSIISSYNRNFPKRNDGNPETLLHRQPRDRDRLLRLRVRSTSTPATTRSSAERRQLLQARAARAGARDPRAGFVDLLRGLPGAARRCRRRRGGGVARERAPAAPHALLQVGRRDYEQLPLLLKAKGKCTTDHISMAGPWLRFRGHLDNISDNMFIGAINAFTDEAGTGLDQLSGEADREFDPRIARHYKEEGLRWVVVGDENYGEGSSREHAAMCPASWVRRRCSCGSFARIHESNLKKQGVLPLTFVDPADYDKVQERDRISIERPHRARPGTSLSTSTSPRGRAARIPSQVRTHPQRRADRLVRGWLGVESVARTGGLTARVGRYSLAISMRLSHPLVLGINSGRAKAAAMTAVACRIGPMPPWTRLLPKKV